MYNVWSVFKTKIYKVGSVATCLRCGGMSSDHFITNLLLSLPGKELKKSVIFDEIMKLGNLAV